MSTLSGILSGAVKKLLFHPVRITDVEPVGECFRLLRMHGKVFEGLKWIPGETIQIYVGELTKRAYTPMDVNPDKGSAHFLVYLHGEGPGAAWAASARAGDLCQVMRPKRSIDFPGFTGPVVFFGDETSLAAAQALHFCKGQGALEPGDRPRFTLEVNSPDQAEVVLRRLGVSGFSLVQRREDGSHLSEVVSSLTGQASSLHLPQWVFTGQARSIQGVQKELRRAGVTLDGSRTKAYWAPGKTGLD